MNKKTQQVLIFESHSTSIDNEQFVASGHFDSPLSEKGIIQAKQLGNRYKISEIEIVCCSDLQRSFKTAEIAFPGKVPILKDKRLREWDYGAFNGYSVDEVEPQKKCCIQNPFPRGESLEDAVSRILKCIDELIEIYSNKNLLFIGHRATYYALEHRYNHISLFELVEKAWSWQPGWRYFSEDEI